MDNTRLLKIERALRSWMGWRRRRALRSLVDDSSPEAVRIISDAAVHAGNLKAEADYVDALRIMAENDSREAQEVICYHVISKAHPLSTRIALDHGYLPHDPGLCSVFYFLTAQWEKYEVLDFDHRLIRTAYNTMSPEIRTRILSKAREAGRLELLSVVAGGSRGVRMRNMSPAEWDTVTTILSEAHRWDDVWRLVHSAPAARSMRLLGLLANAGYSPSDDAHREFLDRLIDVAKTLEHDWTGLGSMVTCTAIVRARGGPVRCLRISPGGKFIASVSGDTAYLHRVADGAMLCEMTGHEGIVTCLEFSPDGAMISTGGHDGAIRLWRVPDGLSLGTLHEHEAGITALVFSQAGDLLASASKDHTIRLWDPGNVTYQTVLKGHKDYVNSIALTPDASLLASASDDETVRVWNLASASVIDTPEYHLGRITSVAISPDGKILASSDSTGGVRLAKLPDCKLFSSFDKPDTDVLCMTFSPCGRYMAAGDTGGFVRLWDSSDDKLVRTLGGHSADVAQVMFSPDGGILASASGDKTVRLWSLADGVLLDELIGHEAQVTGIAFMSEGRALMSGSVDGTIRYWSSDIRRIIDTPVADSTLKDCQSVEKILKFAKLGETEKQWLRYVHLLMTWKWREAPIVEEMPMSIDLGEFDIELAP